MDKIKKQGDKTMVFREACLMFPCKKLRVGRQLWCEQNISAIIYLSSCVSYGLHI